MILRTNPDMSPLEMQSKAQIVTAALSYRVKTLGLVKDSYGLVGLVIQNSEDTEKYPS